MVVPSLLFCTLNDSMWLKISQEKVTLSLSKDTWSIMAKALERKTPIRSTGAAVLMHLKLAISNGTSSKESFLYLSPFRNSDFFEYTDFFQRQPQRFRNRSVHLDVCVVLPQMDPAFMFCESQFTVFICCYCITSGRISLDFTTFAWRTEEQNPLKSPILCSFFIHFPDLLNTCSSTSNGRVWMGQISPLSSSEKRGNIYTQGTVLGWGSMFLLLFLQIFMLKKFLPSLQHSQASLAGIHSYTHPSLLA